MRLIILAALLSGSAFHLQAQGATSLQESPRPHWNLYSTYMLASSAVLPRAYDPLLSPDRVKIASAAEELRRRPGVVEEMIAEIEKWETGPMDLQPYYLALTQVFKVTPEQQRRLMNAIRANWRHAQSVMAAQRSTDAGKGLLGSIEFLGAHPGKESEGLLLEMMDAADIALRFSSAEILAESGSSNALSALQRKRDEARAVLDKFPVETAPYNRYSKAVKLLEDRIRSGTAPASFPANSSLAGASLEGPVNSRRRGDGEKSFGREPFVWLSGAAVLMAAGAVALKRLRRH